MGAFDNSILFNLRMSIRPEFVEELSVLDDAVEVEMGDSESVEVEMGDSESVEGEVEGITSNTFAESTNRSEHIDYSNALGLGLRYTNVSEEVINDYFAISNIKNVINMLWESKLLDTLPLQMEVLAYDEDSVGEMQKYLNGTETVEDASGEDS